MCHESQAMRLPFASGLKAAALAIALTIGCERSPSQHATPNQPSVEVAVPTQRFNLESNQPLVEALLNGNKDRFEELLDAGADPNAWDEMGRNAVTVAAAIPNSQYWLAGVLNSGGNPHIKVPTAPPGTPNWFTGSTPLHCAVGVADNMLNLRILVEDAKVDVDAEDARGLTPLAHAAGSRQYEYADYLVEKGADPSAKAIDGGTVREFAKFIASDDYGGVLTQEETAGLNKLRNRLNAVKDETTDQLSR